MSLHRQLRWASVIVAGFLLSLMVRLWAMTCRVRVHNDPRPRLRRAGRAYVYALLHEHQITAVLANDEASMGAMVSRSTDGDLLVPSLRARGVVAARGSSAGRRGSKGGAAALLRLIALNQQGYPVLLAVDGPRGPRGTAHGGVVTLARATGATILPVAAKARRHWVLRKTWDQTQVPCWGTTIDLKFAEPIDGRSHESTEIMQAAIARALHQLA